MSDNMLDVIFKTGVPPVEGGYPGFNPRTHTEDGIICEYDVAVTMRDGVKLYVDIFRPEKEGKYPALIAWSPYGKHCPLKYAFMPKCGVSDAYFRYGIFEAGEPAYWCANDYVIINVDPRGAWNSEGDLTFFSNQEAEDGYDMVEWAAAADWCSGKVGMHGVSYLSWSQWKVAALNPPHLAAINPWEGVSDFYRELFFHGGIPDTVFIPNLITSMSFSNNRVEDYVAMAKEHLLFDEYWAGKNADLSSIKVPAYVVASWSDHGLHTRGTLEAFKKITSEEKWLMIHGRMKWKSFYEHVEQQRQFFDRFLKGVDSEVKYWPKVKLEIRERYYVGNFRDEAEWPLSRTEYVKLFLNAADGSLRNEEIEKISKVRYCVDDITDKTQNAKFEIKFDQKHELTGHMKLRLWVQADGGDDMDLFVAIQKIDRTGGIVNFPFFSANEDGPVALGWLRVSHREIDEANSTPQQPVLKHASEIKLSPDEIVPVDIEILPSGTLFEKGETLRVIVQGSDIYVYPGEMTTSGHTDTVNKGNHVIYTGGNYESHLLIPVIN